MLNQRIRGCLIFFISVVVAANLAFFWFWWWLEIESGWLGLSLQQRVELYLIPLPVAILALSGHYRQIFARIEHPSILRAIGISLRLNLTIGFGFIFVYFVLKDVGLSRLFLIAYLGFSFVLNALVFRLLPPVLLRILFPNGQRVPAAIFGNGEFPAPLRDYVRRSQRLGVRYVGYYSDRQQELHGIEWLGRTDEVLQVEGGRKKLRVAQVLSFVDDFRDEDFLNAVDRCLIAGARVQIYSNFSSAFADPVRITVEDSIPFLTFYDEPLQNPLNVALKRLLDLAVSLPVVIGLLPPLFGLVWLAQRFQSPGPVLYRQKRHGMGKRPFQILKFRTMHVRPDPGDEIRQAKAGDARVYPFGAFLRRTSLDEFPQFINVLLGSMSVVGPRPHLTTHDAIFEKEFKRYRTRQFIKPGITGWAQIHGLRGEISHRDLIIQRVRKDIEYITCWNLRLDLTIILRTAWQVLRPPRTAH